jgi:hypothetical protein
MKLTHWGACYASFASGLVLFVATLGFTGDFALAVVIGFTGVLVFATVLDLASDFTFVSALPLAADLAFSASLASSFASSFFFRDRIILRHS